jgi:hypothetical protein
MPDSKEEAETLLTRFAEEEGMQGAELLAEGNGVAGDVPIAGSSVRLRVELPDGFPAELPSVYLEPWDALGFLPHVDKRGKVCFFEREGLVVDRRHSGAVLSHAFGEALGILRDGVAGDNADEFAREFENYWAQRDDTTSIESLVEASGHARRIVWACPTKGSKKNAFLAERDAQVRHYLGGKSIRGEYVMRKALFVSLREEARIRPPRPDGDFWSASEVRSIVNEHVPRSDRRRLERLAQKCVAQSGIVLLAFPKPDGGRGVVGIQFDQPEGGEGHPLIDDGAAQQLRPMNIARRDRGYLVPRGGGEAELAERSVLVVGCGAVGGHIAEGLAQAGILNLKLVDSDRLLPENTFRHVLGRALWGVNKAQGVAVTMQRDLPYVSAEYEKSKIETALAEGAAEFSDFDLVVFATGDPSIELEMNELLRSTGGEPPAVHSWVDPHGIGGHALLTGNATGGACFECLYRAPDGQFCFHNRAAFAAPGQSFGKKVSGCGSLFTPYGAADAVRTAELATRLAVDALTGEEEGNPLRSWKGRSEDFEAAGFEVSHRYAASERQLKERRYAFASAQCPVCSARAEAKASQ